MTHAAGRRLSESRMRENRTSRSMRRCRKRAARQRACALLYAGHRQGGAALRRGVDESLVGMDGTGVNRDNGVQSMSGS